MVTSAASTAAALSVLLSWMVSSTFDSVIDASSARVASRPTVKTLPLTVLPSVSVIVAALPLRTLPR
jgi:hypothetical protein